MAMDKETNDDPLIPFGSSIQDGEEFASDVKRKEFDLMKPMINLGGTIKLPNRRPAFKKKAVKKVKSEILKSSLRKNLKKTRRKRKKRRSLL